MIHRFVFASCFIVIFGEHLLDSAAGQTNDFIDCFSIKADLKIPKLLERKNLERTKLGGQRFKETIESFAKTKAYHVTYLPTDWKLESKKKLPVIVEFAGNGPYKNKYGDVCSGRVEDCKLGFGISGGEGYIWVCLPFLNGKGTANVSSWWGDPPDYDPARTIEYCKKALSMICEKWGGDPNKVLLVGFSRGAIACNYIGLHDDEIAKLWSGFVAFSHYDGVIKSWPYSNDDRKSATTRLKRLGGRPQFICAEGGGSVDATRKYLESTGAKDDFTFRTIGSTLKVAGIEAFRAFRNHNDAWILRPSDTRKELRKWVARVMDSANQD
jgi:hypothetical protein